jgi:hypothetical protein
MYDVVFCLKLMQNNKEKDLNNPVPDNPRNIEESKLNFQFCL